MRYERTTAAPVRQALRIASDFLRARIPLEEQVPDAHSVRLSGRDGTAFLTAHRHGLATVVMAETDQVSTSRLDIEVQHTLNQLPYQPGDVPKL
ncbi:MAG: hypothetical protein ACRELD_09030 [Longimicrobiales bacterium]